VSRQPPARIPQFHIIISMSRSVLTDDLPRLSGIYTAGFFKMSTWIPLSWGIINAVVLILSSFAIQGGL
jgi:hypothetical protein